MVDKNKPLCVVKRFTNEEICRATAHLLLRAPEVVYLIKQVELGLVSIDQDDWTMKMFSLAPIINELGITKNLSETASLLFRIRENIRVGLTND